MKCYKHTDVDAVATCAECGKALCAECAVDVAGKIHCQECLATPAAVTSQRAAAGPFNRMALISMICGLVGWLLWLLICCFNSTIGSVLSAATLGVALLCLIPIALIPDLGWIAAVVTGHMGIKQISESGRAEGGREMALAGLISGYIGIGLTLCGCLVSVILTAAGVSIPFIPFIDAILQGLGG